MEDDWDPLASSLERHVSLAPITIGNHHSRDNATCTMQADLTILQFNALTQLYCNNHSIPVRTCPTLFATGQLPHPEYDISNCSVPLTIHNDSKNIPLDTRLFENTTAEMTLHLVAAKGCTKAWISQEQALPGLKDLNIIVKLVNAESASVQTVAAGAGRLNSGTSHYGAGTCSC